MRQKSMWQGQDLEEAPSERFHEQTGIHQEQRDLFVRLLRGERLLVIRPASRTLYSQMADICLPHLTLVFSPLKAPLRDRCERNNSFYGIPSALVSSDKSFQENCATFTRAMAGTIKVLFLATDQLDNAEWQRYLLKLKIGLLVVEQVHCVSMESHDVQQHYRKIVGTVSDSLAPGTPTLLLTEAINRRVEMDILRQFCAVDVIRYSSQYSHLALHVVRLHGDWEKLCYIAMILLQQKDAGIIYTATQESAIMITLFLSSYDIEAVYEPTMCDDGKRSDAQYHWGVSSYRVLCRTTGQGEDKSGIRFVIHYHAPDSLINYYREIHSFAPYKGRIWSILLYDPVDVMLQEQSLEQNDPQEQHCKEVLSLLQAHSQGIGENNLLLNTGFSEFRLKVILNDLLAQGLVTFSKDTRRYKPMLKFCSRSDRQVHEEENIDFSLYEQIRRRKLNELATLRHYAQTPHCHTAYLSHYLGNAVTAHDRCGLCSNCDKLQFPDAHATERIHIAVTRFLENDFLPRIEPQNREEGQAYEAGWALAYHNGSQIGRQVHACKYYDAGPFPLSLVLRATEIAKTRYPIQNLQAVVSIPPSESGSLVEQFARQIATRLDKEYVVGLVKIRSTSIQKRLSNRDQKANNVRGAFAVREPEKLVRCTLLLIDDIYDSGCTLYEAGKTLREAGAEAVYPLTITRMLSANQE